MRDVQRRRSGRRSRSPPPAAPSTDGLHQREEDGEATRTDKVTGPGTPPFAGDLRRSSAAVELGLAARCRRGREERRESERGKVSEREKDRDGSLGSYPPASKQAGRQAGWRGHGGAASSFWLRKKKKEKKCNFAENPLTFSRIAESCQQPLWTIILRA